jgi:hypothetical protein
MDTADPPLLTHSGLAARKDNAAQQRVAGGVGFADRDLWNIRSASGSALLSLNIGHPDHLEATAKGFAESIASPA